MMNYPFLHGVSQQYLASSQYIHISSAIVGSLVIHRVSALIERATPDNSDNFW